MQKQFKICYLRDNKIEKIHIYNGKKGYDNQNITPFYKEDRSVFDGVFNRNELENIEKNEIPVLFCKYIYL